jgi:hypothetical protein
VPVIRVAGNQWQRALQYRMSKKEHPMSQCDFVPWSLRGEQKSALIRAIRGFNSEVKLSLNQTDENIDGW